MTPADAAFDALRVVERIQEEEGGAMEAEVHAFTYLACLMSVFEGRAPGWWGYTFTATSAGAPYAQALADAIDELVAGGNLIPTDQGLRISQRGADEVEFLAGLSVGARDLYLEAATATALMLPLAAIPAALTHEPQLRSALRWTRASELLDEDGLILVHEQFEMIERALEAQDADPRADLLVPAVVWLAYLAEQAADDERAPDMAA